MAIFEFRRHSIKDGMPKGTIGPQGTLFGRSVGAQQLRGKQFDCYAVSDIARTKQSLEAFADGAGWGDVTAKTVLAPIYVVSPELQVMWRVCHAAAKKGHDMVAAAFAHNASLVEQTSLTVEHLFNEWVRSLPSISHVLVVGHSPHAEFLVFALCGMKMKGLSECQGFRIHTSVLADGVRVNSIVELIADDLDPSTIRRELFEQTPSQDEVQKYKKLWSKDK